MTIIDSRAWELFLRKFPNHHFLQSSQWGDLKADFGWNVFRVISSTAGSQVLFRKIPLGYTIGYIAKGPVGNNWNSLWPEIDKLCRNQKAIYLLIEFDYFDSQAPIDYEKLADFIETSDSIQPRRTIIIDINKPENEILQNMRQKTRYNINLAVKKEIKIIRTNDISIFDSLMKQTGHRDHFSVHNFAYYSSVYSKFNPTGNCELFLATFENKPLAAIMVFLQGERAWYLYGASSNLERNRMPTYLLQWEAIKWAKAKGCRQYDLWGIPDFDYEQLETQFEKRSDGLWGIYRFKRGFGGQVMRSLKPKVKVYMPTLYKLANFLRGSKMETNS